MADIMEKGGRVRAASTPFEPSLEEALDRLEFLTGVVRRFGLFAFVSMITCVALCLLVILRMGLYQMALQVTFYLAIGLWIATIVSVTLHETNRKQGEAIFEEVSDELQWHVRYLGEYDKAPSSNSRPELRARVTLRSFTRTTDLPLIPGSFGPALYVAVSTLSLFAATWFFRLTI